MSDYLWDKTGVPDPEVQRLEHLLSPFRYRPNVAVMRRRRPRTVLWAAAAAAGILLASLALWRIAGSQAWSVSVVQADGPSHTLRLRAGQTLETAVGETAHLSLARVGNLDVEPQTVLRVVTSRSSQQHFELVRGTIHARIGAPPGVFVVATPSATATDLGCSYTLHVEPSGDGLLRVNSGLIEFDWNTRRALVPTGAIALTRAGRGPGTPFFEDATPAFREALSRFDFDPAASPMALHTVLELARPRDAVTLLNLIPTVDASGRREVVGRLAQILPPPPEVDREALLAGHFETLQAWWNALGLRHHPAVRLF